MGRALRLALAVVSFIGLGAAGEAAAQHFGRNKVEYVDFDFKVLATEHFDVHYYASEEEAARLAARLAERWYARLSQALGHKLGTRQPLILYASQPEFAQTNVVSSFLGDGIGGVTESAKRRIVMPFAPTLAETDQILGHEIVHAFQFDITRRHRSGIAWPLWAVEGMAQYLSLGADDAESATWLRDAVASELLPAKRGDAEQKFSPYRYGHAMWAYLAGRFGDRVIADTLKAKGSIDKRLAKATGVELDRLYTDWRTAANEHFAPAIARWNGSSPSPLIRERRSGRYHLGPAISPDGHRAVFFSEKDRLSIDLYLADTNSGTITKKLVTTSGSARYETLQAVRSAGSWSPEGDRFVFAAVEQGRPALVVLDVKDGGPDRKIALPRLGQILTPSWSPDGKWIAFSALDGGATDLYLYELASGNLRRLTHDVFADLQPAWSADGRQIAFVTDRFTSSLESLRFGRLELAVVDAAGGEPRRVAALDGASHFNPQWCGDEALYFIADPDGVRNVYRLELDNGRLLRITDFIGGVIGLAPTSPALSVARHAPAIAYTVYRDGRYQMELRRGADMLKGEIVVQDAATAAALSAEALTRALSRPDPSASTLPPAARASTTVAELLEDASVDVADGPETQARPYSPTLFVEAVGQPFLSSGGGPLGTSWRGGGSLLFSDLLGERKVLMYAQISNRLRETAFGVRYLNRERRWNWGASAELQPSLRRVPRRRVGEEDGLLAVTRETQYFDRSQLRVAGHVAYPLNQAQRFEVDGGIRHTRYRQTVISTVRAFETGRLLSRNTTSGSTHPASTVGEVSAALVGDTAVWGPASPILGGRYRFEVASTLGELAVTRLLLDHRRYMMPVKPFTIATRLLHTGYYGHDSNDPRLLPSFLGSRYFVRGYGWNSLRCPVTAEGECSAFDDLLGTRMLVGNVEVRFPVMGLLSRDLRYGVIPAEGFLFADTGLVWSRSPLFTAADAARHRVTSVGAGLRVAAFFPLELAVVRALDRPARGWSFDLSFRTGF